MSDTSDSCQFTYDTRTRECAPPPRKQYAFKPPPFPAPRLSKNDKPPEEADAAAEDKEKIKVGDTDFTPAMLRR